MELKRYKKEVKKFNRYKRYLTKEEFLRAEEIYKNLLENTSVSRENESHCYQRIFPVLAIYKALEKVDKDPFERTKKIFFDLEVYPGTNMMRRIFKIPYLYKMVPRMAYKTTKKSYKESEDGFQIDYLEAKKDILKINIKQCPYFNYCKMFGLEEVCDIFCESDEIAARAMEPNIIFERERTIARGGEHCDFTYRIKKDKENL